MSAEAGPIRMQPMGQVRHILSKLDANDRTYAAMIGLKRGIIEFSSLKIVFGAPLWGFRLALGNSMLNLSCDDFSPHSLTAGPAPVFYSCAWSLV